MNTALTNAKIARVKQDLQTFTNAVQVAESNTGEVLGQITGDYCSGCALGTGWNGTTSIDGLPDSNSGVQQWYADLQKIQTACNGDCNNIITMKRDPWDGPYVLDENELENSPTNCTHDSIKSAGPDGMLENDGDDIGIDLPFASGTCTSG